MAVLAPTPTPDEVIAEIVARLYEVRAFDWSAQDKGAWLAAIKLQLQEKPKAEVYEEYSWEKLLRW